MKNTYGYKFYCRESKANKEGIAKVEMSITINQKRVFVNLPFECSPKDFNSKRKPKEIEDYISLMRVRMNEIMVDMLANKEPITSERIREYIRTGGYKSFTIERCCNEFISIQSRRKDLSKAACRKYELAMNLMFEFYNKEDEITSITPSSMQRFYNVIADKYKTNTAIKYLNNIKAIVRYAIDNGYLKINPFQNLRPKKENKPIEFLTEKELNKIQNHNYPTSALRRIADVFLVQAYSGLSYVDLEELKKDDIQFLEDGTAYIRKPRHKTGVIFTAVLFPQGLEILKKYDYKLPIISNQKMNTTLKIIAMEAGITKNIYTHIGRKTYGTMLINRNISIDIVAEALGHSQSRTTKTYYASLQKETIINQLSKAINNN